MSRFGQLLGSHLPSPQPGLARRLTPKVIVLLIAIPIAVLVIWLATRTDAGKRATKFATLTSHSYTRPSGTIPKPSPGKLAEPTPPPHPRQPSPTGPQLQASNAASNSTTNPGTSYSSLQVTPAPIPAAPNAAPSTSATVARPPYAPLSYNARHEKAFGGCSGQLILSSSGLQFICPGDSHGSMQVALSEISEVDENGVRLASGKKLHFSIAGMTKAGAHAIFADWFSHLH